MPESVVRTGLPAIDPSPTLQPLFDNLQWPLAALVVARRCSGKSTLIRSMVYGLLKDEKNRSRFRASDIVVFSNTSRSGVCDDYRWLGNDKRVVQGFQESVLQRICEHQLERTRRAKELARKTGERVKLNHVLVILDDVISGGSDGLARSGALQWAFASGRHALVSVIVVSQATTVILSPLIRSNSTASLYGTLSFGQMKAAFESTPGLGCTFKEFFAYVTEATQDFGFVYYNAHAQRTEDRLHRIRADPSNTPEFRVGDSTEKGKKKKK
jgi:hypothetical protein